MMELNDFQNLLKGNVSLVDFNAPWCGPCKAQEPIMHELMEQYKTKVSVMEVNIDEKKELASHFRVQSIPTLIIFKNGQETKRFVGLQSKATLSKSLNQIL